MIAEFGLPVALLADLLSAFEQDVVKQSYASEAELLEKWTAPMPGDEQGRSLQDMATFVKNLFGGRIPPDLRASITEYVEDALKATKRDPAQRDAQVQRLARGLAAYLASAVLDFNTPSDQWEKVWRYMDSPPRFVLPRPVRCWQVKSPRPEDSPPGRGRTFHSRSSW